MSVPELPLVPILLAAEALLVTRKHGRRAAKRCNSRKRRALEALAGDDLWTRLLPSVGVQLTPAEETAGAGAAQDLIRRSCEICGRCARNGLAPP